MTKELLTVEFRYYQVPPSNAHSEWTSKKITIGVFETIEEAINKGNEVLNELSKNYTFRQDDYFKLSHLFGSPKRLVYGWTKYRQHEFYAKIDRLEYDDLAETVAFVRKSTNDFIKYDKNQKEY